MKARFFALAALVLGLASCQQEFDGAATVGGEVDFQLNVAAPDFGTRADLDYDGQNSHDSAFGAIDYLSDAEWENVDLRYTLEVYDVADDYTNAVPVKDRLVKIVDKYEPVAFDLRLVPNRSYHFVVFADFVPENSDENVNPAIEAQRDLGWHHTIGDNLGQISIKNDGINNELTDAYFATKDITISNSAAQDIVLRRPYGKVRVITTDLNELNLNVEPKFVNVEYTANHPVAFNAVTGEVSGEYKTNQYKYEYAEISKLSLANHLYTEYYDAMKATPNAEGVERHTHMTLFTDYILASKDGQTPYNFTMTVYDQDAIEIKKTEFSTDIPVERNMLTTVIGNVLTTATEINVTIDDNFASEKLIKAVFVSSARELQEALNAYENDQTILFDGNIEGNVVINQLLEKNYVIDGNGYKYDGVIEINGNARQADPDSVTLRNINFETTKEGINVIDSNENKKYGNNYNYAHNITIENCKFNLGEGSVALKFRQSKNVVIKNCEMTAGHSFAQFYGVNGVSVEYVQVDNTKNGISFGTSTNAVVKESTFEVEGYGFRGEPGGDLIADGIKISADKPVIVRKLQNGNYNLTINSSELESYMGYQVIFTNGDDEGALVEPQGTFNFETDGEYLVFPGDVKIAYDAFSLQAAIDAAAKGETIYVAGKCNCEGIFLINKDINIKGFAAGATITGKVGIIAGSDNTTFENIKFVVNDETEKGAPNGQTNKNGIVVVYASAVGFNNCSFEGMTEAVYAIFNKDNNATERVTVENCKFNGNRAIRTRANVVVDGCTFVGNTKPIVDVLGFGASDVEGYVQFTNNDAKVNAPVAGVMLKVGNHEFRHVVFNVGDNHEDINSIWRDAAHSHANLANFTREFTNEVKIINYDAEEAYEVATANQLQLLLDDDVNVLNIEVTDKIDYVGKGFEIYRDATIDFNNNVLNAGSTASSYWYALQIENGDVTIKNANFTRAGVWAEQGANVVFESGVINHNPERTSRYIFCSQSGATITVKGGTFTNDRAKNSFFWADNSTIIVEGGNFGGVASNDKVVLTNGGQVIIKGGTFNFDPTAYLAEGYEAVKSGSTWTVSAL